MKKGFVLVETMIVSLFVLISVVMLYKGFSVVITKAKNRNNYDNIADVYKLKTILNKVNLSGVNYSVDITPVSGFDDVEIILYGNANGKFYALKNNYSLNNLTSNAALNNSLIDYIRTLNKSKKYYIYEYEKEGTYHYVSLEAGD